MILALVCSVITFSLGIRTGIWMHRTKMRLIRLRLDRWLRAIGACDVRGAGEVAVDILDAMVREENT
jgi:hypothetical protein